MLVLKLNPGKTIRIGDTFIRLRKGEAPVVLCIDAPRHREIRRMDDDAVHAMQRREEEGLEARKEPAA